MRELERLAQTEVRQDAADYSSSRGNWKLNIPKLSDLRVRHQRIGHVAAA